MIGFIYKIFIEIWSFLMKMLVKPIQVNKIVTCAILALGSGFFNAALANQDYYGEWVGEVTQMDNNSHWHISMSLNEKGLSIKYPTLNCGGYLEFLEKKGDVFIFREHITENKARCTDKGILHLKKVNDNKLDWEYYMPNNGALNAKTQVVKKVNTEELPPNNETLNAKPQVVQKRNVKEFLSNPSQYQKELMANGLWYDERTGLIWDRCGIGQTWNGSGCEGTGFRTEYKSIAEKVRELNNDNYLGSNQWQIPTIIQLQTLIQCSDWERTTEVAMQPFSDDKMKVWNKCSGTPSKTLHGFYDKTKLNETIFPDTPNGSASWSELGKLHDTFYWSSTKNDNGKYFGSDVHNGGIYWLDDYNSARLVLTTHSKEFKVHQDLVFTNYNNKLQKAEQERQTKIDNFRKNLQVGDDASAGMVIEIKGDLIKIQTNDSQCSQRDYKGNCSNWINTPVEKWVKRRELYPAN